MRGVEDDVVFGAFAAAWNAMTVSAGLLIDAQADVNAVDSYGRTPLHFCARMGLTPMAEKLVSMKYGTILMRRFAFGVHAPVA